MPKKMPVATLLAWSMLYGTIANAGIAFALYGAPVVESRPGFWLGLLYLGLVVSAGVYILSNYAVRHLPVARMSLLGCVTAPLGAALSALILGTEISALDIAAIALVIGAVALPTFLKLRSPAAVEPKR